MPAPEKLAASRRSGWPSWRAAYPGLIDEASLSSMVVDEQRVARRERWLRSPVAGQVMLVAECQGVLLGGAFLIGCRDDLVNAAELASLYVDPDVRYSGAGTALLTAGFARTGEPVQVLWTLEGNALARRFYERHAFAVDGACRLLDVPGSPYEIRHRRLRP